VDLDASELLPEGKDPGLLIRESWVRIPPGPLELLADSDPALRPSA
jgi:hypothetical protein